MKHILLGLFCFVLTFAACSSQKKARSAIVFQGIAGYVLFESGNRMPMKGAPENPPKGIRATVFVYEPTHISQVTRIGTSPVYTVINTKMVASVESDSTGAFSVKLPPGSYSLFVKQGKYFYANLFDEKNNISLYKVEARKTTKATILINSSASY